MTLQNKLYYDETHLEMVLNIIASYKDQSKRCAFSLTARHVRCGMLMRAHSYLDAIVHLTYVLMRMLEKYSKNTDAMYVRKKKKSAKRKSKGATVPPALIRDVDTPTEAEDGVQHDMPSEEDEPKLTYAEHAFHFDRYEQVRLAVLPYQRLH